MNSPLPTATAKPPAGDVPSQLVSVVHLVLTLNIGGLEKVVYDLVRRTDRERFSVRVLCLGEIGDLGPAFEQIGVPVEGLNIHGKGALHGIAALVRRLRELRPDILHTHNAAPHIVGALAARCAGVSGVVHTRHGAHRFDGWKAMLGNRLATFLIHRLVAVSRATADIARGHDGVPEKRLAIIHNGVDLDVYGRGSAGRNGGCLRAIHAARLTCKFKDQRTLLQAVRRVANEVPEFHLTIVGDGPDRAELEMLCDELQLRRHVTFLGSRHDVPDLLREADLFLLSSVSEGLPMTLLEAMAAGLPVVTTDVGGISELVKEGETGRLVAPRSPEALGSAILELVHNPQKAVAMGAAGRRRVEEEFNLRSVVARYEAVYRELLKR